MSASDGLDVDQYDALSPTYLLVVDQQSVVGCVRLLPTTGCNMLANTFPVLLDSRDAPNSPTIWKSSRFFVDTRTSESPTTNSLRSATFLLFAAMIEWGRQPRRLPAENEAWIPMLDRPLSPRQRVFRRRVIASVSPKMRRASSRNFPSFDGGARPAVGALEQSAA